MANSVQTSGGKRERLVASAKELIHEQGVHRTTLAQVAERADVPLGNVYYYFKSKNDLVGAVVDDYANEAAALLAALEQQRTPQARLKGLIRNWVEMRELVARHGCPIGSLCTELDKLDGDRDAPPAALMTTIIDWAEAQLRRLGRREARDLAISLFAGLQGAAVIANTLGDPDIMARQGRQLERWVDTLGQ
jgi:TetR/AcrR family transcriptional regulator, transcriptional repressor for nem operon